MKIIWSATAASELDDHIRFVAQDSLAAAFQVQDRILAAARKIAEFPGRGRPGRLAGSREIVVARTSCLIVYTVAAERIDILRIMHGARQWPLE